MTIRIEPDLASTKDVVGKILAHILVGETRVAFLVPAGEAEDMLARIRTMISRKRKVVESAGKRAKIFRLHSSIHRETYDGKRYDCIICWRLTNESHRMAEDLEDILANG